MYLDKPILQVGSLPTNPVFNTRATYIDKSEKVWTIDPLLSLSEIIINYPEKIYAVVLSELTSTEANYKSIIFALADKSKNA